MWSLPSRRMRRSSVCTRQWTSPWSTCSCTSACSCTARFADGTAMHTLTNTRPTDRHTCTYRLIKKPRVSSTRIFLVSFFALCSKRPPFPSPGPSRQEEGRSDSIPFFLHAETLCTDTWTFCAAISTVKWDNPCVSSKSKSYRNCTKDKRSDLVLFAPARILSTKFPFPILINL